MAEIIVNEPEVSGSREDTVKELTPEQKAERIEFLESKLEDYKDRIKTINSELKALQ